MLPILISDLYKYLALAVMLLAILFGYRKGRNVVSASSQSLAWTQVPLIAFAIASIGPSAFAIIIYLGYKFGLVQPEPSGYSFSIFIRELPFDFAVINWGFVVLYLTCRLWPNFGSARSAMWLSMVAMSLPNVFLFAPAWEMVSNASGVGQGIGVILAMISLPIITIIWPGSYPSIFDAGFGIGFVISALMAPIPFFGLIGWLVGQLIGWTAPIFYEKQLCGLSPLLAQSRLSESSSRLSAFWGQSGHGDAGRSRSSPPPMTQSGQQRAAFAALHGRDLPYSALSLGLGQR